MIKKLLLPLVFVGLISISFGQKSSKGLLSPTKFGIQITQGNEQSFLFDDPDYFYRTNTIKLQFFYPITHWKKLDISFIVQPQVQRIQHQLYNKHFVRPEEENYLEKRARYTRLKTLSITAVEFTIDLKRHLFTNTSLFFQLGLGLAIIDTATERLTEGFTFIENANTGIEYSINTKTSIRLFGGFGHVSNLNFQLPNAGYNTLNIGFSIHCALE